MGFAARVGDNKLYRYSTNLLGRHQADNALTAIMAVRNFTRLAGVPLTQEMIRKGIANTQWPGRFEKIRDDPQVYIDIAHTPKAAATLTETLRLLFPNQKILVMVGAHEVRTRENAKGIIENLVSDASIVMATRSYHKGMHVHVVKTLAREARPGIEVHKSDDLAKALEMAIALAKSQNMLLLVAGSLALAAKTKELVAGCSPKNLLFFN